MWDRERDRERDLDPRGKGSLPFLPGEPDPEKPEGPRFLWVFRPLVEEEEEGKVSELESLYLRGFRGSDLVLDRVLMELFGIRISSSLEEGREEGSILGGVFDSAAP